MRKGTKMKLESRIKMSKSRLGKKKPSITVPLATRLWSRVNKYGPIHPVLKTNCWEWTGSVVGNRTKYGQIQIDGRPKKCHRVSWEITNGTIPEGGQVLHKCDNPVCVRPDHLFLGSHQDNMDDMINKGRKRTAVGVRVGGAKLDDHKVKLMRLLRSQGRSIVSLGKEFGVCTYVAACAIKRKTWKHVK